MRVTEVNEETNQPAETDNSYIWMQIQLIH